MCCQSQETKGALFTSRETAQPLQGVMRVPSPAALPEQHAQALCCPAQAFCGSLCCESCSPSAREDPALKQEGGGLQLRGGVG